MSVVLKIVKWLLAIALAGVFIFAGGPTRGDARESNPHVRRPLVADCAAPSVVCSQQADQPHPAGDIRIPREGLQRHHQDLVRRTAANRNREAKDERDAPGPSPGSCLFPSGVWCLSCVGRPWSLTGWSADTLRAVIGVSEVTFGLLALCPHYTRLSAFFFLSAMIGATYTHVAMQEPFIVTVVLGGLSFLLFLVSGDAVASTKKSVSAKKTN